MKLLTVLVQAVIVTLALVLLIFTVAAAAMLVMWATSSVTVL